MKHLKAGGKRRGPVRAAVVGASGYTGAELLRLLFEHPGAKVTGCTSDSLKGERVGAAFPQFQDAAGGMKFRPHEDALNGALEADVYFLALPHGAAVPFAEAALKRGKAIDLSADHRLKKASDCRTWYGIEGPKPSVRKQTVYGLCELNRDAIRTARLTANPGCYPTGVGLALLPLAPFRRHFDSVIVADSKSGYSGAGKSPKTPLLLSEGHGEFKAYGAVGHRHIPEMEQTASAVLGGGAWRVAFTPHLIPIARGIETTVYLRLVKPLEEGRVRKAFEDRYAREPFVRLLAPGETPSVKRTAGTNFCELNVFLDERTRVLKVLTSIDNLVKGAAGQAVQNMNLMFGAPETEGLERLPVTP